MSDPGERAVGPPPSPSGRRPAAAAPSLSAGQDHRAAEATAQAAESGSTSLADDAEPVAAALRLLTMEEAVAVAASQGLEISQRTFRYYAVMGLLPPSSQSPSGTEDGRVNYYPPDVVDRLLTIRRLQAEGYSLKQIRTWIDLQEASPASPCATQSRRERQRVRIARLRGAVGELSAASTASDAAGLPAVGPDSTSTPAPTGRIQPQASGDKPDAARSAPLHRAVPSPPQVETKGGSDPRLEEDNREAAPTLEAGPREPDVPASVGSDIPGGGSDAASIDGLALLSFFAGTVPEEALQAFLSTVLADEREPVLRQAALRYYETLIGGLIGDDAARRAVRGAVAAMDPLDVDALVSPLRRMRERERDPAAAGLPLARVLRAIQAHPAPRTTHPLRPPTNRHAPPCERKLTRPPPSLRDWKVTSRCFQRSAAR